MDVRKEEKIIKFFKRSKREDWVHIRRIYKTLYDLHNGNPLHTQLGTRIKPQRTGTEKETT